MKLTCQIDKYVTLTIDDTAVDTTIENMEWFFRTVLTFMTFHPDTIEKLFAGEIYSELGKEDDD